MLVRGMILYQIFKKMGQNRLVPTLEWYHRTGSAHRVLWTTLTLIRMGEVVFFIISVRDAAEPRNLVIFPKI